MAESTSEAQVLELDDIQGTALRQRPAPYTGAYFLLRIDDPADGRQRHGTAFRPTSADIVIDRAGARLASQLG